MSTRDPEHSEYEMTEAITSARGERPKTPILEDEAVYDVDPNDK